MLTFRESRVLPTGMRHRCSARAPTGLPAAGVPIRYKREQLLLRGAGSPGPFSSAMMSLSGSGSPTLVAEVAQRMNSRAGGHMATCTSPGRVVVADESDVADVDGEQVEPSRLWLPAEVGGYVIGVAARLTGVVVLARWQRERLLAAATVTRRCAPSRV